MKPVRTLGRAGVAAAAAIVLASTGTPARAATVEEMCGSISGGHATNNLISLCAGITWFSGDLEADFGLHSKVFFDPGVTSATECEVTMYVELDKPGSDIWKSPKNTKSCNWALEHKGSHQRITHQSSKTSATHARAHACVDLYYNHSSSSGWQRCMVGAWEDRG